jgi:two-component system, OmpR family, KDP operon response regulator KdpE
MSLRLLLIEDDRELRASLLEALQLEGHAVQPAASLADARRLWEQAQHQHQGYELVLLDLGLPDGDGEALLQAWRGSGVPLLVISARDPVDGKIRLLDAGADDYLVKPFAIGELLARIRVALRHRGRPQQPAITHYRGAGVEIDLARRRVARDGEPVHLTPREFALLARLLRQAGQVVTHRQLLADVWGAEQVEQTQYLRLYMAQLRQKLEAEPAAPRLLLTETGVGYRLAEGD